MTQLNRPLAPHLSSYKPQITSLISIFHRISGFMLSFCFIFNSFYFIFLSSFVSFGYLFIFFYFCFLIFLYLYFVILLSLFFHFLNGIRHLLWDFCLGLDLKNLSFTGLSVVLIATFLILLFIIF